ncbi:MAG: isoprenylcysteine carboxylmethyltransferase family protein [candidate division Zixibacteria bacterium]|nr:isoprenylcysteine carboxylmethyltransferase family protein [candidate division Zixibacteria bacterium]
MARVLAFVYGVICYLVFFATFLYAIWFVWTMDQHSPASGPWQKALAIDAVVLAVFALQHSIMARQGFKRAWTKAIPHPIERSTYVLLASLALLLIIRLWQPLPGVVWNLESSVGHLILQGLFWLGWATVLVSTFLIGHFDLFGLKQVWLFLRGETYQPPAFVKPGLYKFVRHPIYMGFTLAFWSTPHMTTGHLFFAIMTLAYVLVAIQLEERDLITFHGEEYRIYRSGVSMLVPWPSKR